MKREGDWMQTASGRQFWPIDPRPDEVFLQDISAALSKQCRFAGHCTEFYSVAEHSVRVSWLARESGADERMQLAALLHDASEAYAVDVPRPLKPFLTGYKAIEESLEEAIGLRFGLAPGALRHGAIKHWDNVLLATEKRDLMGHAPAPWVALPEPLEGRIVAWKPAVAQRRFLDRARDLGIEAD